MSTSRTREKADGELFKSTGIDDNATSTAVTIDSSGSVLIGGTTVASSAGGLNVETTSSGNITSTIVMQNQATGNNSGVNLAFRGQRNSGAQADYTYIQSVADDTAAGNGSIRFHTALGGTIAERMKLDSAGDLTISGGVYLGGTGAANKLDDYEEGTWTPATNCLTISAGDIKVANYTKIGNLVTVQVYMDDLGSTGNGNHAVFTGLPFLCVSSGWSCGVLSHSGSNNVVTNPYARVASGTAQVDLKKDNDTIMVGTEVDASHIIFTISYHTNS